jgi:DHA1 family bicyclomycin/chloramphenicol resistance-like MFS transporter
LATSSVDIYLPYLPYLKNLFHTTEWFMQLSILVNPFVASFTGFIFGHLSERLGRRPILLWALVVFSLGALGQSLCGSAETFLLFRLVQAIGVGGIHILTLAILSDTFQGAAYARHFATFGVMFPITFALAPIIGAQLFTYFGWRSSFVLLFCLGILVAGVFYKLLPETKAAKKITHNHMGDSLLVSLWHLTKNKYFINMALIHCLPVAISTIFLTNSAFIFIENYAFSPTSFSYVQTLPFIANIAGTLIYQRYVTFFPPQDALKFGFFTLLSFLIGSCLTLVLPDSYSIVLILLSFAVFNFGIGFNVASSATLAFESLHEQKSIGIAYFSCLRNILSSLSAMACAAFYTGTVIPVFISMMIIAIILMVIMTPWAFYKFIRKFNV